jgi:hypothetical protein
MKFLSPRVTNISIALWIYYSWRDLLSTGIFKTSHSFRLVEVLSSCSCLTCYCFNNSGLAHESSSKFAQPACLLVTS